MATLQGQKHGVSIIGTASYQTVRVSVNSTETHSILTCNLSFLCKTENRYHVVTMTTKKLPADLGGKRGMILHSHA